MYQVPIADGTSYQKLVAQNNIILLQSGVAGAGGGQNPKQVLLGGLKPGVIRGVFLLKAPGGSLFPCLSQLLEYTCISWLVAPSPIFKVRSTFKPL